MEKSNFLNPNNSYENSVAGKFSVFFCDFRGFYFAVFVEKCNESISLTARGVAPVP